MSLLSKIQLLKWDNKFTHNSDVFIQFSNNMFPTNYKMASDFTAFWMPLCKKHSLHLGYYFITIEKYIMVYTQLSH